ncbi:MAG: hypothetical protein GY801_30125 [bacterium]|nr:hypothetical protein [bacterium]
MYKTLSYLRLSLCVRHCAFALMMIISFLFLTTAAGAGNPEWIVYDSSNSGLPKYCAVYDLALDAQGTLWIGTNKGLVQFGGTTWTTYTTENSGLPSNQVQALVFDAQETLWVGTADGLARFNGKTWTVYTTENSGLPYNAIHELVLDVQGNLWIGTGMWRHFGSGGLAKFDGTTWTAYTKDNSELPHNHIIGLALDAQGNPWVGTPGGGGVTHFDGETWTVYTGGNSELPWGAAPALAFDTQGNLWIAMEPGGVVQFDGTTWTVYTTENSGLPDNSVPELVFDTHENLWVGTKKGLAKFDGTAWTAYTTENSGLPGNWIETVLPDIRGNIWMGTSTDGLAVYREGGVMHPAQKTDPESVMRVIFDALNVKDIDGALEFVTDDTVITIVMAPNRFVFTGKEEIRDWWTLTQIEENTFAEFGGFQVEGAKASWSAKISTDPWRALGVTPIHCSAESIVQNGMLKSHTFTISAESIAKLQIASNKEIARRFIDEIWNEGDMTVADGIIAEDFVNHNPFGDLPPDREGLKIVAAGSAATPGIMTIDDMIAEGNKVALRVPSHGDPEFEALLILYVEDGKITDRWGYHDHDQKFAEANKKIARRWVEEIWNKGDLSVIDEIVASDYVDRSPARGQGTDRETIKSKVTWFRAAFPDAHFAITDMIAEGDKVVVPQTFTGTHQGEFSGAPATGKQVTWTGIFIYRIKDGKIVERWGELDTMGFMIQIGAVPPPGEGGK